MDFNLEKAILQWQKSRLNGDIEPADQEELVSHLRDKCEDLISEGTDPEAAFHEAVEAMNIRHVELSNEYYKSKLKKVGQTRYEDPLNHRLRSGFNASIILLNIRYWFKIFIKNKGQLVQNLIGLVTGIVMCTITFYYGNYELSYDGFHANKDRLFRVRNDVVSTTTGAIENARATSYFGVADALKSNIPEVQDATHVYIESAVIIQDENVLSLEKVLYSTPSLFSMFSIPLLAGDAADMDSPDGIFISESFAQKLFGNENPMGQTVRYLAMRLNNEFDFVVRGVYQDIPLNSYFKNTDAFLPMQVLRNYHSPTLRWAPYTLEQVSWRWSDYITFVALSEEGDPAAAQDKIQVLFDENRRAFDEKADRKQVVRVEPVEAIHLVTGLHNEMEPGINKDSIHLFFGIGVLVMLIAWVNYINMSTATAVNRAKEIGIKKAFGVFPNQIRNQFMMESILLTLLALVLSYGLVLLLSSQLSALLGTPFSLGVKDLPFFLILASILITGSLVASFYPAMVLSSFQTIEVLKSAIKQGKQGVLIRKLLVVFQFAIVTFLITGMLVAYKQFGFMMNRDLGFDIQQKISIDLPPHIFRDDNFESKLNRLGATIEQLPQVSKLSTSSTLPGDPNGWRHTLSVSDAKSEKLVTFGRMAASSNYLDIMNISLHAGRDFRSTMASDYDDALIINLAGMKALGYSDPDSLIGKAVTFAGGAQPFTVVGIVEDYHYQSMHSAIEPLAIQLDSIYQGTFLIVEFDAEVSEVIASLQEEFTNTFPETPFVYDFLDGRFRAQYEADLRFQRLFGIFTSVSILLAVMGLLSLSNYFLAQQRKSVSIRKVLGASGWTLSKLLVKEYLLLALLACGFSLPLTYFIVQEWIEGFLYRVDLPIFIYAIPVSMLVLIVLGTISKNVIHLLQVNPAKTLKTE